MVVDQAERHQVLEIDLFIAVGLKQTWACRGQPQALTNKGGRNLVCGRDVVIAHTVLFHRREGVEFVDGMQVFAVAVFRQAVVGGDTVGLDDAGDRRGDVEDTLSDQLQQCPVTPAAALDFVCSGFGAILNNRSDGQTLQQATTLNAVGEGTDAIKVDDVAHIAVGQDEFIQRDGGGRRKDEGRDRNLCLTGLLGGLRFGFGFSHGNAPGLGCRVRGGSLSPATRPGHSKPSPPFTLT